MSENDDDAYAVVEGDRVHFETDKGQSFELTCTDYSTHNARDPDVVQETRTWTFEDDSGNEYMLQKVEGLKRFPDQADYPYENPLAEKPDGHQSEVESYGYIESVNLMGAEV